MEEIIPKCLICGCEIKAISISCVRCETLYHKDCFNYNGECAVYGCVKVPMPLRHRTPSVPTPPPVVDRRSGWGETLLGTLMLSVIVVPLVFAIICAGRVPVRPGEIVVRDYPLGQSSILTYGDSFVEDFFTTTRYAVSTATYFSIPVMFNGHIPAKVSGEIEYKLPQSTDKIMILHKRYGSQDKVEKNVIVELAADELKNVSVNMTDEESLRVDGDSKFVINRLLAKRKPHVGYGIKSYKITVNFIEYEPEFQKKINQQQDVYTEHAIEVARQRAERTEERHNHRSHNRILDTIRYFRNLF